MTNISSIVTPLFIATPLIYRYKKDGSMYAHLPECIASIKHNYMKKDAIGRTLSDLSKLRKYPHAFYHSFKRHHFAF